MRAKKPLTERAISTTKPADAGKRRLLWDAIVPGLALRVTDRGAKSFVLVTRYPGAPHPAPRSLGGYGAVSLEDARVKARAWLALIAKGIDPAAAEVERRAETFRAIAEDYFVRKAKDHRTREWAQAALTRLVYPSLGAKPIDDIGRRDIVRLLDGIEDERGPVMANRTLTIISSLFNWHATRSDTFRSPIVRGMKRVDEQARSRVLSDDELRAIWKATGEYPYPFSRMLRFILLTATRRNEAAHAKRSEIVGAEWTIPAARYKTKIDHAIPLSKMALAEIEQGPAERPVQSEFIFTQNGKVPASSFERHKLAIDEASGVKGFVLHDCRRTSRTLLSRAGVNADIAERCLGHVIGGVRGTYDRHEYVEEKAHAFEALAAQIERIVNPPAANVVAIKGGRDVGRS
jgi:integrase